MSPAISHHKAHLNQKSLSPSPSSLPPMASYPQPHFYDSPSPVSDSSQPPESSRSRGPTRSRADKLHIAHPYARLYAKKDEVKRRRIWNHALEKSIFTPYELYVASTFSVADFNSPLLGQLSERLTGERSIWPVSRHMSTSCTNNC